MSNAGFQIDAKYKKCVDCEKALTAEENAFLCEQFRTLAWGQGFVQRFGSPGALGMLDGLDRLAALRGEETKHHVYCKVCFRKLKKQGWFSKKRECKLCGEVVS